MEMAKKAHEERERLKEEEKQRLEQEKAEQERRTQAINNAGRLTQRAEGKAPRTILEGLVDTDDPEYQAREKARELERIREGLKTLAGSRRRLVEL